MLIPRGLLLLLIYTGVLVGEGLAGRKRDRDRESGDKGRDRDQNRRDRNQARKQRNKEQEEASSSLSQAIESHHMYGKENNPEPHQSHDHKEYSNSTRVIAPYQISQYDHPRPGRLLLYCRDSPLVAFVLTSIG